MRVVVFPDIHGRLDAFKAMLTHSELVDSKFNWLGEKGVRFIQLGDLIDRGKESKACVELAMRLKKQGGPSVVVLKGNHEDLLLQQHKGDEQREEWLINGGTSTETSYAEDAALIAPKGAHWRWLNNRPASYILYDVLFAHGGLQADNPDAMDAESLMWSRPPLDKGKFRALVVGHTPTDSGRVEMEENVFLCDLGLGYKEEAALQYLNFELTPKKIRWTVRVAS